MAGDDRYTKALALPCLPWKLRLDVARPTSPSPSSPKLPPMQGPQQGLSTIAPASMNCSTNPARSTFIYSVRDAGMTSSRTPFATGSSPMMSAAILISSNLPLVHEPTSPIRCRIISLLYTLSGRRLFTLNHSLPVEKVPSEPYAQF